MYEGCLYYVPAKPRQNFLDRKKSVGVPPPPPPPLISFLGGLARLYRLAADGRRMSHSEPSSNVGSPVSMMIARQFCCKLIFIKIQNGRQMTPMGHDLILGPPKFFN